MVDVERRDPVPERLQHVPEARRVGATGDEARDLAAGRDQVALADECLDAREHRRIVAQTSEGGRRGPGLEYVDRPLQPLRVSE